MKILRAIFIIMSFGAMAYIAFAADQTKTTESYIADSDVTVSSNQSYPFTFYIGDNLAGVTYPAVKSLHFNVEGVYTGGGTVTLMIDGDVATTKQFTLPNVGATPTPFEIDYKDPSNKISPLSAGSYAYTLNFNPSGVTVYGLGITMRETHRYVPPVCPDGSSQKTKTTESYIADSDVTVSSNQSYPFTFYIGDNLAGVTYPAVKSLHFNVEGVYTGGGTVTLMIDGDVATTKQFTLPNVGATPTPFEIDYKDPSNKISPLSAGSYAYTLNFNPSGVTVYGLGITMRETHRYVPPVCPDGSSQKTKTTESYIADSDVTVSSNQSYPFTFYIGDNLAGVTYPAVKSLHFNVEGVYTGGGTVTLMIDGDVATTKQFTLPNVGATPTPFEIDYKDPSNKISPLSAGSYAYTLNFNPSGVTVYGLGITMRETHRYVPPVCPDGSSQKTKTTESYIADSDVTVSSNQSYPFTFYIGDNLAGVTYPAVKSLHFNVEGVYTGGGTVTLMIDGDVATTKQFTLPNVGATPTPFEIDYKDPSNKISPLSAGSYAYTLNFNPSGVTVYGLGITMRETHRYVPPVCPDGSSQKTKTTESYIADSDVTVSSNQSYPFTFYIGDNLAGVTYPAVKSLHFNVEGVYTGGGTVTLMIDGDVATTKQFTLPNVGATPTPFEIDYKDPSNKISPLSAGSYAYTLNFNPSGVTVYGLGITMRETHRYVPPVCPDGSSQKTKTTESYIADSDVTVSSNQSYPFTFYIGDNLAGVTYPAVKSL